MHLSNNLLGQGSLLPSREASYSLALWPYPSSLFSVLLQHFPLWKFEFLLNWFSCFFTRSIAFHDIETISSLSSSLRLFLGVRIGIHGSRRSFPWFILSTRWFAFQFPLLCNPLLLTDSSSNEPYIAMFSAYWLSTEVNLPPLFAMTVYVLSFCF